MSLRVLSFVNHVPPSADIQPAIDQAFAWGVDAVVAQGNGMDFGPYWLGSGQQFPVSNFVENIRPYVLACRRHAVPFVLSTGIAGADAQLEECVGGLDRLLEEVGLEADVAVLSGEIDRGWLRKRIEAGSTVRRLVAHAPLPDPLTVEAVDASEHIVGQMGPEPIMAALDAGVDGVLTGRALDVGLFMAVALRAGVSRAVAAHLGKILECGGLALTPGDAGVPIWAEVADDVIEVRSPDPHSTCRAQSIAAHSFYERRDPYREENPGGDLDLRDARYEQVDDRRVRVRGAAWHDRPYTVKLEGAASLGHRAINVAAIRDPRYLGELDGVLTRISQEIRDQPRFAHLREGVDYHLTFSTYGTGVLPGPPLSAGPEEVGVVIDVVARDRETAREICYYAYIGTWIKPYPGRKTSAGNNAQRFTPPIIEGGEVYRWSVWHLLPLDDPLEPFAVRRMRLPGGKVVA